MFRGVKINVVFVVFIGVAIFLLAGCTTRPVGHAISVSDPMSPPKTLAFPETVKNVSFSKGGIVSVTLASERKIHINSATGEKMLDGGYELVHDNPSPVFLLTQNGISYLVGTNSHGEKVWQERLSKGIQSQQALPGGRVLAMSLEGSNIYLVCLNVKSGKAIWKTTYSLAGKSSDAKFYSLLEADRYSLLIDNTIFNVSIKDGHLLSKTKIGDVNMEQVRVFGNFGRVDALVDDSYLYIVDPRKKGIQVKYPLPAPIVYQVRAYKNQMLIAYRISNAQTGRYELKLDSVDIGSGALNWSLTEGVSGIEHWTQGFVVRGDKLYADYDSSVYEVELDSGKVSKSFDLDIDYLKYSAKFRRNDQLVFIGSECVASVGMNSGKTAWEKCLYTQKAAIDLQNMWVAGLGGATQSLARSAEGLNQFDPYGQNLSKGSKAYSSTMLALAVSDLGMELASGIPSGDGYVVDGDYLLYNTAPEMTLGYNNFLKPIPTRVDLVSGSLTYFDGVETNTQTAMGHAITNSALRKTVVWYSQASPLRSDRLSEIDIYTLPAEFFSGNTANNGVSTNDNRGVVIANSLNVRAEPGAQSDVVGKLNKSDVVLLLERTPDGWLRVEFHSGRQGWVSSKYIRAGQ